jgi:hypothetical protein
MENSNADDTLKLCADMEALKNEHGKEVARKRLKKIVADQFKKAEEGETINLSALFAAKETLE